MRPQALEEESAWEAVWAWHTDPPQVASRYTPRVSAWGLQMLSLCKLCLAPPSVQTLFCGQVAEIRRLQEPAWQKPSRSRWWKICSYEKRQIRRHACIPLSIQISRCHRKEVFKARVECAANTRSAMPLTAIAQPNVFFLLIKPLPRASVCATYLAPFTKSKRPWLKNPKKPPRQSLPQI